MAILTIKGHDSLLVSLKMISGCLNIIFIHGGGCGACGSGGGGACGSGGGGGGGGCGACGGVKRHKLCIRLFVLFITIS